MRVRNCVADKDIEVSTLFMHFGLTINFRVSFIRIAYTVIVRFLNALVADKDRNITFLSSSERTQIQVIAHYFSAHSVVAITQSRWLTRSQSGSLRLSPKVLVLS